MKKTRVVLLLVAALVLTLVIFSCRHEMPTPSCDSDPMQLSVSKTDATNNQANGSIAATATGGTGFQYSLNGAAFQDDGNFMGLEPFRNYILVARNSWGCTDTATVSIEMTDPCAGVTVAVSAVKQMLHLTSQTAVLPFQPQEVPALHTASMAELSRPVTFLQTSQLVTMM